MRQMTAWILVLVACLGAASLGRAEVVYDSSATASVTALPNTRATGNSFQNTVGAVAKVTSVTLYLIRAGSATGNLQVNLWNTTGTSGNYAKGSTNLGTGMYGSNNYLDVSTVSTSLTAYTFTFDPSTTAAMTANAVYMWEITGVTSTGGELSTRFGNSGTGTAGMNRIINGAVDTSILAAVVNASAVPEPGTLLLGGIAAACGGGGVWWKRRKGKAVEGEQAAGETIG